MNRKQRLQKIVESAILLEIGDIKSAEDLVEINDYITDYEKEYHFNLRKYRKILILLKKGYQNKSLMNLIESKKGYSNNKKNGN